MKFFDSRSKAQKYRSFGDQARNAKRWRHAARYYSAYIKICPNDDAILVQYGHALKEMGMLAEAERAYNLALETNPDEADTYVQLGHVYKLTNRRDLALEAYREALKRDSELQSALVELEAWARQAPARRDLKTANGAVTANPGDDHRLEPLFRHVTSLLAQLSTVKAISFEVARARGDIERLEAEQRTIQEQIESLAVAAGEEVDRRLAPLSPHVTSLLAQLSTVKAISLGVARAHADIERMGTEHRAAGEQIVALKALLTTELSRLDVEAQARIDGIEDRVARLQEGSEWCKPDLRALSNGLRQVVDQSMERDDRLTTVLDEVNSRFREMERRLEESQKSVGAVSSRLDQLSVQVREVAEAMRRPDPARQAMQDRIEFLEQRARQPAPAEVPPEMRNMLDYFARRNECVRREMLHEFQHESGTVNPVRNATGLLPKIKNRSKIAQARATGKRLNLGCGHIILDEYLNVDRHDRPGIDIIAQADALPFGPGEVRAIHASNLLEHFPEEAMRRSILPHWFDLLEPGGLLTATVPDGAAMLAHAVAEDGKFEKFRDALFGAQDCVGKYRDALYTPAGLSALLQAAGFRSVRVVAEGRRNELCYEFEIAADKPSSQPSAQEAPS